MTTGMKNKMENEIEDMNTYKKIVNSFLEKLRFCLRIFQAPLKNSKVTIKEFNPNDLISAHHSHSSYLFPAFNSNKLTSNSKAHGNLNTFLELSCNIDN